MIIVLTFSDKSIIFVYIRLDSRTHYNYNFSMSKETRRMT